MANFKVLKAGMAEMGFKLYEGGGHWAQCGRKGGGEGGEGGG
jgi:hypothetical protein